MLIASSKMRKTSRSGWDVRSIKTVTACKAMSAAMSKADSHWRVTSAFTSLKMLSRRSACW